MIVWQGGGGRFMDALAAFGDWFVSSFVSLYKAWGTWGVIGAALIVVPVFSRLVRFLRRVIEVF